MRGYKIAKPLSMVLVLLMIISMVPSTILTVFAEEGEGSKEEEKTEYVTITVKDEDDNPLKDAVVKFTVDSATNGNKYIEKEEKTDDKGVVNILSSNKYVENDLTLTATVSLNGYKFTDSEKESLTDILIKSSKDNFDVKLVSTTITDVNIDGLTSTYNGEQQEAVSVSGTKDGDTIEYNYDCEGVEMKDGKPCVKDAGEYPIEVVVKREGFDELKKDITAVIGKAEIKGVSLTPIDHNYDGTEQEILSVVGIDDTTDIVKYVINGEEESSLPITRKLTGEYNIYAVVDRGNNYEVLTTDTVVANINKGIINIDGLKVKALTSEYKIEEDGNPVKQDAVEVSGKTDEYTLMYSLDDGEFTETIPQVTDAGSYKVTVRAVKEYYNDKDVDVEPSVYAEESCNVYVSKIDQTIEFKEEAYREAQSIIEFDKDKNTFDFSAKGGKTESSIIYSIENPFNDGKNINDIAEINSETGELNVKSPGCINVIATKPENKNYNEAVITHQITVKSADHDLIKFEKTEKDYIFGNNNGVISTEKPKFTYSDDNGKLTYSIDKNDIGVVCDSNTGEIKIDDYKKLSESLESIGTVSIKVKASKDKVVKESSKSESPEFPENGEKTVYFEDAKNWGNVYCYYWKNDSDLLKWPGNEMNYVQDDNGHRVYRFDIPKEATHFLFNNGSEKAQTKDLKISDYQNKTLFIPTKNVSNKYEVKIRMNFKEQGKLVPDEKEIFPSDEAYYTIKICQEEIPETPYTLPENDGNDGWYISSVTVTPAEGYQISKEPVNFTDTVEFSDQGSPVRFVYLKNRETGGITGKIYIDIKIDTEAPENPKITFSDSINSKDDHKFYNDEMLIDVDFTADDKTSGLDKVEWSYIREESASTTNKVEDSGEVKFNNNKATIRLSADEANQYRGNIKLTVFDKAGNKTLLTEDGNVYVLDTISPKVSVGYSTYSNLDKDNVAYYGKDVNGKIQGTIIVEESNFYSENLKLTLNKDGNDIDYSNKIEWSNNNSEVNTGTFEISGDADYIVKINYNDYSGNAMMQKVSEEDKDIESGIFGDETYQSRKMVIDTIDPDFSGSFDINNNQTLGFNINEKNFDKKDFDVKQTTVNIKGEIVKDRTELSELLTSFDWESNNYKLSTNDLKNGIYSSTITYSDLAKNTVEINCNFTVDHEKPYNLKFDFNPDKVTAIGNTKYRFNNNSKGKDDEIEVTLTAYDDFIGINDFTWDYIRQEGVSKVNLEKYNNTIQKNHQDDGTVYFMQDDKIKNKFIAKFTLPISESDKLRGMLYAFATDEYGNKSEAKTDSGSVVVIDRVSPEVEVIYSTPHNTVNNKMYYGNNEKGKATITLNITEANFFIENLDTKIEKHIITSDGVKKSVYQNDKAITFKEIKSSKEKDLHTLTYTINGENGIKGDGEYKLKLSYSDYSKNKYNKSQNQVVDYLSKTIVIDTVKPEINVSYDNNEKSGVKTKKGYDKNLRDYFDENRRATVTINEVNFNGSDVNFYDNCEAKYIDGNPVKGVECTSKNYNPKWTKSGNDNVTKVDFNKDANYKFDLAYTDLAGNKADNYVPDYFTVDKTKPGELSIGYSSSVLTETLSNITFGYYQSKVKVTISAFDKVSGVNKFVYNYRKASNVSSVNAELINQAMNEGSFRISEGNTRGTLVFYIPRDALGPNNQFNGTVDFTTTDRSGNENGKSDNRRLVVDNIKPTCQVEFSSPVNQEGGVKYYNGPVNGTIRINEANFNSNDVRANLNGGSSLGHISWSNNGDMHIGTFTISNDGENNVLTVNYADKSGNRMTPYTSEKMTIDTSIDKPIISINGKTSSGNSGAYKGKVNVSFNYSDTNFSSREITLIRKDRANEKDVKNLYIPDDNDIKGNGGNYSFDITKKVTTDGIYTLSIKMLDKAAHSSSESVTFIVNRFGSVYEYSDYLKELIKNGGTYNTIKKGNKVAITNDLVITEYNADKIKAGSLNILITRDGEPVNKVNFKSTPKEDKYKSWNSYSYVISKDNFIKDGKYKITISSEDMTKNSSTSIPENSVDRKGNKILDTMEFTVDTTSPSIRNIMNLEEAIINAQEVNVKYSIMDIGGLKSIEIYVDNKKVDKISDFSKSINNYKGEFKVYEKNDDQNVRIIVKDLAGNITDTNSKNFNPGKLYVFNKNVTVSTNFFVRWFANKPLFYGSLGGAILIIGAAVALILFMRKKKRSKSV